MSQREEEKMAVCPMLSTENKTEQCRADCAWFQPSGTPGGGMCAFLFLAKVVSGITSRP